MNVLICRAYFKLLSGLLTNVCVPFSHTFSSIDLERKSLVFRGNAGEMLREGAYLQRALENGARITHKLSLHFESYASVGPEEHGTRDVL